VRVDPFALAARDLALAEVQRAIGQALGLAPGGGMASGYEQSQVRAVSYPRDTAALGEVVVAPGVVLSDVAKVVEGGALTVGLGTADARGEGLFVMVQLLADADARSTVAGVRERLAEIEGTLESGIELIMVYDREKLVTSTLTTVAKSLAEGALLVIIILFILLGDLRAGLLVASVIPLSLLGAFLGLRVFGYSGNLMSLGAIDFGLVVDGTIVVIESLVGLTVLAKGGVPGADGREAFARRIALNTARVARPVLFAVFILGLVYVPILLLWGTEGKLFRPMALTVLFALGTALFMTFTYVPALASLMIKPKGDHTTVVIRFAQRVHRPMLDGAVKRPLVAALVSVGAIAGAVVLALGMGVEFVPRLEEGDMVVQTKRLPSLSPSTALVEATRVEAAIMRSPEVLSIATRVGSPAVATDPMGLEEGDVLVHLAPRDAWRKGFGREDLVAEINSNIETFAPGAELNFTQPIEMRFSELLEGITADVGVQIFGPDLGVLLGLGQEVASRLERVAGAADTVAPAVEGIPQVEAKVDAGHVARYGLSPEVVLDFVSALRRGRVVGRVPRGGFLDEVVVRLDVPPAVRLADLPIVLPARADGTFPPALPLSELASLETIEIPSVIHRLEASRRVIVTTNVRGRDMGSFVEEAKQALADLELPTGYRLAWKGKFEQLAVAGERMAILVPAVLFAILGILYVVFRNWRAALLIFLNVPVAVSGGLFTLWLVGLPLSMSAIVGCIALFGVAVMNGVVLMTRLTELTPRLGAKQAALSGARERFRPVLTTAAVAGIGFVPMAIATGVGAEVQRPLAIVVIGGLVTATALTLVVLPALYARVFRGVGAS
jgi:cobalt-zinc-cadmium resistance protein CzcA